MAIFVALPYAEQADFPTTQRQIAAPPPPRYPPQFRGWPRLILLTCSHEHPSAGFHSCAQQPAQQQAIEPRPPPPAKVCPCGHQLILTHRKRKLQALKTGYCLTTRGRGDGSVCPTPPPHPHQKTFPPAKNEMYRRGQKFQANFRYINCFLASEPPPPPPPFSLSAGLRKNGCKKCVKTFRSESISTSFLPGRIPPSPRWYWYGASCSPAL